MKQLQVCDTAWEWAAAGVGGVGASDEGALEIVAALPAAVPGYDQSGWDPSAAVPGFGVANGVCSPDVDFMHARFPDAERTHENVRTSLFEPDHRTSRNAERRRDPEGDPPPL